MSTFERRFLFEPETSEEVMHELWNLVCAMNRPCSLTLNNVEALRSVEQNALFHRICGQMEAAGVPWAGITPARIGWKRLLVDAWARATRRAPALLVPTLDELSVVQLGIQTRGLLVSEMSELVEFAMMYRANDEVP